MLPTNEQAQREYIADLLHRFGPPDAGTLLEIQEGDEENYECRPIDEVLEPASAVILFVDGQGSEQCFDKEGYKVYAD